MPKRYRKMKGGYFDSVGNTLSGWENSISEGAQNLWNRTKNASRNAYYYITGTPNPNYYSSGGRRKRTRKHLRGGYMGNTELALNASPVKNLLTGGYTHNKDLDLNAYPVKNMLIGGYRNEKMVALNAAPVHGIINVKGGYGANRNIAVTAAPVYGIKNVKGGYGANRNIGATAYPVKNMKGGYGANRNIGATAAPVHGINTTKIEWLGGGYAQPEWLALGGKILGGGKTKRRKHSKSRKSRRH